MIDEELADTDSRKFDDIIKESERMDTHAVEDTLNLLMETWQNKEDIMNMTRDSKK